MKNGGRVTCAGLVFFAVLCFAVGCADRFAATRQKDPSIEKPAVQTFDLDTRDFVAEQDPGI